MKVAIKCPACHELIFTDIDPQATHYQCIICGETFPILFKLSIETVQDFIDRARTVDGNLFLALRDNLGRRFLKPATVAYFNQMLQDSIDFELHKERKGEYLLIFYLYDNSINIDTVAFVIEKTGVEKTAVKVIEC